MSLINFNLFILAVRQYNTLYSSVLKTRKAFEKTKVSELLVQVSKIEENIEKFLKLSRMEWSDCGNLERHLDYLKCWLSREQKESCISDLDDILFRDLPQALENLVEKAIGENDLEIFDLDQTSPMERSTSQGIQRIDVVEIHFILQKALERKVSDPEGAITSSRTLLESTCKYILDDRGVEYDPNKTDLPELYKKTAKVLNLSPSEHTEEVFKQILGGCSSIVSGLGTLRNRLGDAHGKGRFPIKPASRHAELAVNLSGSMALYLLETHNALRS